MFILSNPAALLALSALLVPLAIHLWNRRPGREVAVGSLRWLAAGANRRLRNLRLEQRWLLLLRAALLAVLAGALAGPAWRRALPAARGQVLLAPGLLGTPALAALRPTLDSLRQRGYGLRWLAAGFRPVPPAAWRADSLGLRDSAQALSPAVGAADFRWARVQQAAGVFAGQPLFVLSAARLRDLQGAHRPLPARVRWQTLPTTDTTDTWLQAAAGQGDSLRLLLGRSAERQTTFRRLTVARPRPGAELQVPGLPPLRQYAQADKQWLRPGPAAADSAGLAPANQVLLRTRPLRTLIYAPPAAVADARVLRAALRAVSVGLPSALTVDVVARRPPAAAGTDWLFWLSEEPLPAAWQDAVRRGTQVWQQAPAPGRTDPAHLLPTGSDEAPVLVRQRGPARAVPAGTGPELAVWADGLGRPVLSRWAAGAGAYYQLHTRLDPAWSELADSPTLPARLLALLEPELTDTPAAAAAGSQLLARHDQRTLDPAQLTARAVPPAGLPGVVPSTFALTDWRPWLVLAAGLLFLLERLLAARRAAAPVSSAPDPLTS